MLQHPLGLTLLPDGSVAILDTYNDAVRRYDPTTRTVTTLATDLREPSGAVLVPTDGGPPDLLVVESAAHKLTRLRLPDSAVRVDPTAYRTRRETTEVRPGTFELEVVFEPPTGQHLDDRYGPSTRLLVSASPPELIVSGAGSGSDLTRVLVLAGDAGDAGGTDGIDEGVLHVAVFAASCDSTDGADPVEFPACHVHQQDWGIPVQVTPGGAPSLTLMLRATTR